MAILKHKTEHQTRMLRVRIPAALLAEIETLKTEAGQAGYVLDTREIVERALSTAVRAARAELQVSGQTK